MTSEIWGISISLIFFFCNVTIIIYDVVDLNARRSLIINEKKTFEKRIIKKKKNTKQEKKRTIGEEKEITKR